MDPPVTTDPAPPRDASVRAPDYAVPAVFPSGAGELSEASRTFARTFVSILELRLLDGDSFDPSAFRQDNRELFCEFDGAMNAMTTAERQQVIDGIGFTRDVLIGKNHLEFHACPLPRHAECQGEPVPVR